MYTAIVKAVVQGELVEYKTTLASKYQLETATSAISRLRPDAVVMIGENLAILAGQFVSAMIISEEA